MEAQRGEYGYQNGNKYYEKLITHTNVFDQSKISSPKLSSPKISNSVESITKNLLIVLCGF